MNCLKHNKFLYILYFFIVPLASLSSTFLSIYIGKTIDIISVFNYSSFPTLAFITIFLALCDLFTHYFHKIIRENLRKSYVADLRKKLFNSIIHMSYTDYTNNPKAYYLSTITRDVDKMALCIFDAYCGIYRIGICLIINIWVILKINYIFSVIIIISGIVSLMIPRIFNNAITSAQDNASRQSENFYSFSNDFLNCFTSVKIYNAMSNFLFKAFATIDNTESYNYKNVITNYRISWISAACTQICYVITVLLGIYLVIKGNLSVGMVIAVTQLSGNIIVPIEELPEHLVNLRSIQPVSKKISAIIGLKKSEGSTSLSHASEVTFKNVYFKYNDSNILEDVNVTFSLNKKYILLGASGSGKSTIAKLMLSMLSPTRGNVYLGPEPANSLSNSTLSDYIAYVEQDTVIFNDSLLNNITMLKPFNENIIKEVIYLSGLSYFVDNLPNKLDTILTTNGENISGGEKQRIGLARALLSNAKFIIMDEISSSLDPSLADSIEQTVMSLNCGVLLITHRRNADAMAKADVIYTISDKKLIELPKKRPDI